MNARLRSGYRCGECSRIHDELKDAAYCCASDRHPVVSCWRCHDCSGLYLYKSEAEACCSVEEEK